MARTPEQEAARNQAFHDAQAALTKAYADPDSSFVLFIASGEAGAESPGPGTISSRAALTWPSAAPLVAAIPKLVGRIVGSYFQDEDTSSPRTAIDDARERAEEAAKAQAKPAPKKKGLFK